MINTDHIPAFIQKIKKYYKGQIRFAKEPA